MKCENPVSLMINIHGAERLQIRRCGGCIGCRVHHQLSWAGAILLEQSAHKSSLFITLTYRQEALPEAGSLSKRDLQLFLKRLRKLLRTAQERESVIPTKLQHYACGEYGDKFGRPHYHLVLFGLPHRHIGLIQKAWPKETMGRIEVSELIPERAHYAARYTLKKLNGQKIYSGGRVNEFSTMSLKPAIGLGPSLHLADTLKRLNGRQMLFLESGGRLSESSWNLERDGLPAFLRLQKRIYPLRRYLRTKMYEHLEVPEDDWKRIERKRHRDHVIEWRSLDVDKELLARYHRDAKFRQTYNTTRSL